MTTPRHGGNLRILAQEAGRPASGLLDFSANINPLGPPDWLRPLIGRHVSDLVHYPDPEASVLVQAAARRYRVAPETILVGNGSAELLSLLAQSPLLPRRAVIPVPSYGDYAHAARVANMDITELPLSETSGFTLDVAPLEPLLATSATVFIGSPNNPNGAVCSAAVIRRLARNHPDSVFIVDEAFGDFVDHFDSLTADRPGNVVVLLSLTKFFAVPGLRIGCAVAGAGLAGDVRTRQTPWSVNTLAQEVGAAALADTDYAARSRAFVRQEREWLSSHLQRLPHLEVFPGAANFLLVKLTHTTLTAPRLSRRLLAEFGIAIRVCDNFRGLDDRYFRLAVRPHPENERLIEALQTILAADRKRVSRPGRIPAIMFQGTSSNAGKSIMTAALCRIFLQDGVRVAPFKAQNMSLNSFVTRDGGEMGRAQVVQAQACRLEPDVRMNPILLKPNSATGSQVIALGKPVGNMTVDEYIRFKREAAAIACRAYDELAANHEVIVLEGAGSPGEVNLKAHDIVNMTMARHAQAPVLLVGDIDRGGVFASFIGTLEVLAEWERALVAGFVVNRFRGQESLLADALDYVLNATGRPVLGVVPNLDNLNLPEEDSVTFKSGALDQKRTDGAVVDIAIIDLPHISNFTDYDAFRGEPDVHLRVVRSPGELGQPDALIIPGSKNTLHDLHALKTSGLGRRICDVAAGGKTEVVGLCGGFQMIGATVTDPGSVESAADRAEGFGLLAVHTVMRAEKTLVRTTARHVPSGRMVHGYEIHHGETRATLPAPLLIRPDGEVIGMASTNGLVWGTYLHGVFDADDFRRWFIDRLRVRRGLPPLGRIVCPYDIEPALDRLAETVRHALRMDELYKLVGLR